jgi:hypothetical protein
MRDRRSPTEIEDYETHQWWDVPEIIRSQGRFYPSGLPELLPRFLAGEEIDEPFEYWDLRPAAA